MKKILLAFVTLASVKSFALEPKDPFYVCNRVTSDALKTQCVSTISGRYVDPLAAAACDRISSSQATVECMAAIVDRQFDPRAVESCDSIAGSAQTVQCLAQVGQPFRGGGGVVRPGPVPDSRQRVKELARYGLQQLDAGNLNEVRRILSDLLRN